MYLFHLYALEMSAYEKIDSESDTTRRKKDLEILRSRHRRTGGGTSNDSCSYGRKKQRWRQSQGTHHRTTGLEQYIRHELAIFKETNTFVKDRRNSLLKSLALSREIIKSRDIINGADRRY